MEWTDALSAASNVHHPAKMSLLLWKAKHFFYRIGSAESESFKKFFLDLRENGILRVTHPSQMHCKNPRCAQIIGVARTIRSEMLIDLATCEADDID